MLQIYFLAGVTEIYCQGFELELRISSTCLVLLVLANTQLYVYLCYINDMLQIIYQHFIHNSRSSI